MSSIFDRPHGHDWFKEDFPDHPFNVEEFQLREYSGERALLDRNGKSMRMSEIGANWYNAPHVPVDWAASKNGLYVPMKGYGHLLGKNLTSPSKVKPPLNLQKELPPVPPFHEGQSKAQDVAEAKRGAGAVAPAIRRVETAGFDYMFADADETEVITIHDDSDKSLALSEILEDSENEDAGVDDDATEVITVHDDSDDSLGLSELLEDDEDEDAGGDDDVEPPTPPQVFQQQPQHINIGNQFIDLSSVAASDVHGQTFAMAGTAVTTDDLIENYLIAAGTNLAAPLITNAEHERDKVQATDAFFNGPVADNPSPYHAPLIHEGSGYGDVREGCEHMPEAWPQLVPESKYLPCEGLVDEAAATLADDDAFVPDGKAITKANNGLAGLADRAKERRAKKAQEEVHTATNKTLAAVIDLTSDDRASETSSISRKRRACSSLVRDSALGEDSYDDDYDFLYTKKVCTTAERHNDELFSIGHPSAYSIITQPGLEEFGIAARPISNPGLLSKISGVKGFKGQFKGIPTAAQAERALKPHEAKVPALMGQADHLNNMILHRDLHTCPYFDTTEYQPDTAPADSDLGRCISYAQQKMDGAAEMVRTRGEEALRQEAHRECSAARLEGAAIGFYRYFQGHLTVEEYHEREMCICWQICECSKLCTRFADMMCPCVDKIETNCH